MEIYIDLLNDTLYETGIIIASIPMEVWQLLACAAAVAAAVGAFLSARATRLAAQGQLFSNLLTRYSSEEMRKALLEMGNLKRIRQQSEKKIP